ncbi:hypothetical protein H109_06814 [Trichophyton interdigitale MR816]|uniref:Uncharacterized protein n=1 Tax=Trichophyton interdigitale (strain MR816) TaxID=1215338 RepID=A0A059J083_TRIIM|nr:hypothetical protein H101_02359 [Trichophyton interdigitale H6]KDB21245.1 hypothetical protein H109_06814 [Trichophyton interdigitale MR816]
MFIERRRSTGDGYQKRVLFSPKGFIQHLCEDMAAHGFFAKEELSDMDDPVNLTGCPRDSIRASHSSRVRIRISVSPQVKGHRRSPGIQREVEYDEPRSTTFSLANNSSIAGFRRKRSPSPTPSMTSTSSTEGITRPSRKKATIMKPLNKFKEVVPVVHIPEFKELPVKSRRFREVSPSVRRKGDPVVITPRVKPTVPRNTTPEATKSNTPPSPKNGKKKVRFVLGDDDGRRESPPVHGVAKRL